MTAAQWLILHNLKNDWPYRTNLSLDNAETAYRQCVENQWIKDGQLTGEGHVALASRHIFETQP